MRRSDTERDAAFALEVLDKAPFVTVSMTREDGTPYGLPLSLARTGDKTFYFHCALEGEKLDCIAYNPVVFLSAVARCSPTFDSKVGNFTLQYRSATAVGVAELRHWTRNAARQLWRSRPCQKAKTSQVVLAQVLRFGDEYKRVLRR